MEDLHDNELTDEEMEEVVADLDEEDLRARSQKLDEAQELYEEMAYLGVAKMPCPECTGAGSVSSGSLGDICVKCFGKRVIDHPGAEPMKMPPFKQLRAAIGKYGDALADRLLLPGDDGTPHKGKRNLALPPPPSVPTLEEIQAIYDTGKAKAKELQAAEMPQLTAPQKPQGLLSDDGGLDDYTDADLEEMEEAAEDND